MTSNVFDHNFKFQMDHISRYGRKNTIFWSQFLYFMGNLGTALCYILFQFLESSEWKRYIVLIVVSSLRCKLLKANLTFS